MAGLVTRASDARFVGREAELAAFSAAIATEQPPFTVLFVHEPGGVGKTTLLRRFASLATGMARTDIRRVLFRLITSEGRPNVKIEATQLGGAAGFGGEDDPTYATLSARGTSASLKLTDQNGRQQLIEP